MVAVASGSLARAAQVLKSPGVDAHYICRSSSHPAAFGMNALLVALMLQLPDIAEVLVNKLLELMGNPNSTVFLRDDVDEQQGNEASGIGKIKHSVKSVRMVDYIQSYNATLVQDLLSSRHARTHTHTHTHTLPLTLPQTPTPPRHRPHVRLPLGLRPPPAQVLPAGQAAGKRCNSTPPLALQP